MADSHLRLIPSLKGIPPNDSFLIRPSDVRYLWETFIHESYGGHYQPQPNDVVVDMGAGIGDFALSISPLKPKHIYCIEPSPQTFEMLKYNTRNLPVTLINKVMKNTLAPYNTTIEDFVEVDIMNFKDFTKQYNLEYIDFLKMDIEGAEYDIFTEENISYLKNKVKHIVLELHIQYGNNDFRDQFLHFREHILPRFHDYKVTQVISIHPEINKHYLTSDLYSDDFENNYNGLNLHIFNTPE